MVPLALESGSLVIDFVSPITPESVKINNCTNKEGNGILCALLAWREGILKEKSLLSELGK